MYVEACFSLQCVWDLTILKRSPIYHREEQRLREKGLRLPAIPTEVHAIEGGHFERSSINYRLPAAGQNTPKESSRRTNQLKNTQAIIIQYFLF